jgi:hypothetical protein
MHSEDFEDMFTYVGQAPELTPEEKEEEERLIKRMDENLMKELQRLKMGLRRDGTKYEDGEFEKFMKR